MKLLVVSHYFASHRGGIEVVAGRLAKELAEAGIDVTWLATDASPPPAWDAARLRTVAVGASNMAERWIGIPYPLPTPRAVRRILAEVARADAVVVHDGLYLTSVLAALASRRLTKPLMVVQHIGFVPYGSAVLRGLMRLGNRVVVQTILRAADKVVFISATTARYFDTVRYRTVPDLIFNGVDPKVFAPARSRDAIATARRRLGLPEDRLVVLFVGRFVEKKGLAVLERMVRARPDYHFAFAGWGHLDPRRWNAVNTQVFDQLSGASLAELYQASDVFTLPSVGEGFPLVIQEALACGLPVLCGQETASADGGAAALLTGIPLDLRDPGGAADGFLVELDRVAAGDRSTQARQRRAGEAAKRYSWKRAADAYLHILEELHSAASRRPLATEPRLADVG